MSAVSLPFDEKMTELASRLRNRALQVLQTCGGLALSDITGCASFGVTSSRIDTIHQLTDRLRADRLLAPTRAALVLSRLAHPQRVLDVGAGRAPWSIALAHAAPNSSIVAVDLPEQMTVLKQSVDESGCSKQFQFTAADVFSSDFDPGTGFSLAIVANVAHLFPLSRNATLFHTIAQRLAPGGVLAIIDQFLDDEPDWRIWSALYAVGLPNIMPGGHLFTAKQYTEVLSSVGLHVELIQPLSAPPAHQVMIARLPK